MMGFKSSTAMNRMLGFARCWANATFTIDKNTAVKINTNLYILLILFDEYINNVGFTG
jgi:hypothetical protein